MAGKTSETSKVFERGIREAKKMVVESANKGEFEALQELFKHHIDSYDHLVESGLDDVLRSVTPVSVYDASTETKLRNILFFI